MATVMPPEFAELEPFISQWAFSTENERSMRRWDSSKAEFNSFYHAFLPLLPAIIKRLSGFNVKEVPEEIKQLFYLTMAFAEMAPHVELYRGSAQVPFSFDAKRFVATHGNAEV